VHLVKSLLVILAICCATWVAVVLGVLHGLHLWTGRPVAAGFGAALFGGSFAWMAGACASAAWRAARERGAILRGLDGGSAPPSQDGPIVLAGRIESSQPLEAPFDGRDAALYTYEVTIDKKIGRTMSRIPLYRGVGLAPARIVTQAGAFRLLAVPTIEGTTNDSESDLSSAAARQRVAQHLRRTTFTPGKRSADELVARWSDDDGAYRSDVSWVAAPGETGANLTEPPDLAACRYVQTVVTPGTEVCAFGHYSVERGGLVALSAFSHVTRLVLGDPAHAAAFLGRRARLQVIFATLLGAAAAGVAFAYRG
jgi:hypothetical protein